MERILLIDFHAHRHLVFLHRHDATHHGKLLAAILDDAFLQRRDDGCMVGENLEVTHYAGHFHALYLAVKLHPFGRYYLQF